MIFNKTYPGVDNAIQSHFCGSSKNGLGQLHVVIRGSNNFGNSKKILKTLVPSIHIYFTKESKLSIPERIQSAVACINSICLTHQAQNPNMKNFTCSLALALIEHNGRAWFASIGNCQILVSIDNNTFQVNSPSEDIESETAVNQNGNLIIQTTSFVERIGQEKSLDYLVVYEPVQLRNHDFVLLSTRNLYHYFSNEKVNSIFLNPKKYDAIEIIAEKIKETDIINGVALSMCLQEEKSETKSPFSNPEIIYDNTAKKLFFRNENDTLSNQLKYQNGLKPNYVKDTPSVSNLQKKEIISRQDSGKINSRLTLIFIVIFSLFVIALIYFGKS